MAASSTKVEDLRIVLLGKTGSGKSATGNTILGKSAFLAKKSPSSVTKESKKETAQLDGRTVTVVDTPGMFDTLIPVKKLKSEIEKCVELSLPGPHVFLLVISLAPRFTEEEKNAIKWITENFGEEASKYTIVVFTGGDDLEGTIESYLEESNELMNVISDCKAGCVVFDNKRQGSHTQVTNLFKAIDRAVELNGDHYTSDIYRKVQRKLWWQKVRTFALTAGRNVAISAVLAGGIAVAGPAVGLTGDAVRATASAAAHAAADAAAQAAAGAAAAGGAILEKKVLTIIGKGI